MELKQHQPHLHKLPLNNNQQHNNPFLITPIEKVQYGPKVWPLLSRSEDKTRTGLTALQGSKALVSHLISSVSVHHSDWTLFPTKLKQTMRNVYNVLPSQYDPLGCINFIHYESKVLLWANNIINKIIPYPLWPADGSVWMGEWTPKPGSHLLSHTVDELQVSCEVKDRVIHFLWQLWNSIWFSGIHRDNKLGLHDLVKKLYCDYCGQYFDCDTINGIMRVAWFQRKYNMNHHQKCESKHWNLLTLLNSMYGLRK